MEPTDTKQPASPAEGRASITILPPDDVMAQLEQIATAEGVHVGMLVAQFIVEGIADWHLQHGSPRASRQGD